MKEPNPFECCESLGRKIALTLKAMIKKLGIIFEENDIDLTSEQYFLLNILDERENLILQDIADMLEKDKSALTRHIDALEEKLYVTRVTCEKDKRKKLLLLTKPGIEILEKARNISEQAENNLFKNIKEDHIKIFENVLEEIVTRTYNPS